MVWLVLSPQTLLHEMIHALLFVTQNNRDRDGHGPEFCKHMNRINEASGTRITVSRYFPLVGVCRWLTRAGRCLPFPSLLLSGLPHFPRRGGRVPAALVEMRWALPEPQTLLWLRKEGNEPGSV